MLCKLGVDIHRLERPMRRALNEVDKAFQDTVQGEAILTSTYEGDHQAGSLHYANLAADFRLRYYDMAVRDDLKLAVKKRLEARWGRFQYDVLFSANDSVLHVEFDPK